MKDNKDKKNLRELIGQVVEKKPDKVYDKKSKFYGQSYYRLEVKIENKPLVKTIFVYSDLVEKEQVWKDIKEANYVDKRYLFYCSQWMNIFKLVDWKELTNHGSN